MCNFSVDEDDWVDTVVSGRLLTYVSNNVGFNDVPEERGRSTEHVRTSGTRSLIGTIGNATDLYDDKLILAYRLYLLSI